MRAWSPPGAGLAVRRLARVGLAPRREGICRLGSQKVADALSRNLLGSAERLSKEGDAQFFDHPACLKETALASGIERQTLCCFLCVY